MSSDDRSPCERSSLVSDYAMGALAPTEAYDVAAHISGCSDCRRELDALTRIVDSLVVPTTDLLRPPADLGVRLAQRVADEAKVPAVLPESQGPEPQWVEVGGGISSVVLATDADTRMVSMLVRLAPGAEYPPHSHHGIEELFLLQGELWIDDRKLHPGDYNRAEPGTADARVYSETGCTCVLITSLDDELAR